ncbi:MAG: hypothetical protein PHS97_06165 [Oscillospiraceae bacterium]|nr:hypothetical protein [Oscillospiraceae bacterium]
MQNKLSVVAVWILAVLPLILVAAFYRQLPPQIAIAWRQVGAAQSGPKWALWIMTGIAIVLAVVMTNKGNRSVMAVCTVSAEAVICCMVLCVLVAALRPGTLSALRLTVMLAGAALVVGSILPKSQAIGSAALMVAGLAAIPAALLLPVLAAMILVAAGILAFVGVTAVSRVCRTKSKKR